MNVRFFSGTKAQYLSLTVPRNPLGLYFCEDTHELFWGDKLLSDGIRVVPTKADLPKLANAADGVVYYVTETRNGYTLSPDRAQWLQTIYAPATDAYKVPESEIYNTVTTVGAVRDIESKIYKTIDEKLVAPDVDLSNYYTKSEVADVIASAVGVKADKVLFTDNKFINNPIGSFKAGDNVKGWTLSDLFVNLLGLTDTFGGEEPDDPGVSDSIIEEIVTRKIPMYSVTDEGEISEISYDEVITYTEEAAAEQPNKSGFYQIVDESGEVIESGYQELTAINQDIPYIIALPISIDFNSMITVQTYDTIVTKWKNESLELTNNYEEINGLCSELGVDISHIDTTKYTLWADLEKGPTGKIHRFIIIE